MYFCIINLLCFGAADVVLLLVVLFFQKFFENRFNQNCSWNAYKPFSNGKTKPSSNNSSSHSLFRRTYVIFSKWPALVWKVIQAFWENFIFVSHSNWQKMEAKSKQNKKIMRFIRPWVAPKWVPKAVSVPSTKGWFQLSRTLRRFTGVTNQSYFCKWSYSNWTMGLGIRWCEVFYQKRWSHWYGLDRK